MPRAETISRRRCVVDGSGRLEPLFRFADFPVYMGVTDGPPEQDLVQDMAWAICRDCGCIQLAELIPAEILYARSHNSGLVGRIWTQHHAAFAEFVLEHAPRSVLEVGAGHGLLSIEVHKRRPDVAWTVVEPNPTPQPGCRARFIRGFFPRDLEPALSADALVNSHFIEHLFAPAEFFRQAAGFLKPGQMHLFSVPNMPEMLARKYNNCLNFEHSYYLTPSCVARFAADAGFEIVARRSFLDDHSHFYALRRCAGPVPAPLPAPGACAENRTLFEAYTRHHRDDVARLNAFLEADPGPVFLFGAHVFSQYLCAFGLRHARIRAILDNDPGKQGRRLAGTGLRVDSPRVLAGEASPAVILRAGAYDAEIRADIVANVNPGTRFL